MTVAGKAKGTFYVHFKNRTDYLVTLHQLFHDRLRTVVTEAVANISPGQQRLHEGTQAYLNFCLKAQGVKALLLEARSEPTIASEVQRRNQEFAQLAEIDFVAMGWQPAYQCAYFYITMVAEAALLQLQAGQLEQEVRQGLARFISFPT